MAEPRSGGGGIVAWTARHRPEILLATLVLVVSGPIVQVLMAHQSSRLAFTAAIWDQGTVRIDAYEDILGVDYAERDGRLYSDKAPGQPFLAAPFYGAARALGAEPGEVQRPFNNYTLWWTSFWSAVVPLIVLSVLMRRLALQVAGPRAATAAAVAVTFGTLLLPFSTVLFSHVLAAALCFGAYLAGREPEAPPARLASAGFLGGLAVVTEYTAGIVVVVLGIVVLLRHRTGILAYVAGGLPAAAMLAVYNTVAWGSPTLFSYDFSASFADFHQQGLFGIRIPDPVLTVQVLAGERGLLTMTPIVLVGLIGLAQLALSSSSPLRAGEARLVRGREIGVVGLIVFAGFVAVQGGWFSVTAGASPGPRYVVAALPFVAAGVARVWRSSPVLVVGAGSIGAVGMLASIATNPLAQPTEDFAVGHWIWRLVNDRWGDTLLSPFMPDPWAHVVQLLVALGVLVALWRASGQAAPRQVVHRRQSLDLADHP
ncbi:hypothetical protein [Euzebya tangerina]|uniref:hypothetical protein n=1 Tax=Euzebya tangerina TaxID=591198 RepID=UPI000E31DCF7|nr:hypothetical protein [Euzebya tangerina]